MTEKGVGDWVEAGELLIFTSGRYSSYGVNGVYRAKQRFQIPGTVSSDRRTEPDIYGLSANAALIEELAFSEISRSE